MAVVTEFPRAVRVIENEWIPLADGTRLAARLWLPEDAARNPVPALLEYLPYRKRDSMRLRDDPMHHYFAGHGYAGARVDIRGTGDSDGLIADEYMQQEQDDALEVIAWLAGQPWCSGAVGMFGISWGGFNSLQVAARRPPALRCIITLGSTDDRYATDVHYMGGCMTKDNPDWGAVMFSHASTPPDPEIVGERWRAMWMARLENLQPWVIPWLEHQRRDAYWKHGSVCEDFGRIDVPVYAVNGWADNYAASILRLLAGLKGPREGLIGPWAHNFPHNGRPGPAIGWLQEALRWWDRWLKGADTGIMDEPMLRAWMPEPVPPAASYAERPGRWVAEDEWPSPRLKPHSILASWPRAPARKRRCRWHRRRRWGWAPARSVATARARNSPPTSARTTAARCCSFRSRWPSGWTSSANPSSSWSSRRTNRTASSRCGSTTWPPTAAHSASPTGC
jgi:putative CocE/NonD family hydrolase